MHPVPWHVGLNKCIKMAHFLYRNRSDRVMLICYKLSGKRNFFLKCYLSIKAGQKFYAQMKLSVRNQ